MAVKTLAQVQQILHGKAYPLLDDTYTYLVEMPMNSVTTENVHKLLLKRDQKALELTTLMATSEKQMWLNELDALRAVYVAQRAKAVPKGPSSVDDGVAKKKRKVVK